MDRAAALPLSDREVVITFDDGPVPRYSKQILDILAAQCVKATFFLVGEMAHAHPATVRRIFAEGHTIGTTARIILCASANCRAHSLNTRLIRALSTLGWRLAIIGK